MPRKQLPFAPFPLGSMALAVSGNGDPSLIVLRGDHDASNVAELSRTLALATARGHSSVIIDMSGVAFMSAATVGALVAARRLLEAQSRHLVVRAPSRPATRLLGVCGLTALIEPGSAGGAASPGALASWVEVPPVVRRSTGMP